MDLDGTLVRSDTLVESLYLLIKSKPWSIFLVPLWILSGRLNFKNQVASRAEIDPARLPIDPSFFGFFKKRAGYGNKAYTRYSCS